MFYIYIGGKQAYKPLDDELVLFNPKLTLEIGKAGSLEFDIPPSNPFYDRLDQLTTEVSVELDTEEIFHGRVLSNERTFSNLKHIYCEGDLSYLIDSVQKGTRYSGTTHGLFDRIIANHNARVDAAKRFMVGTVNIEDRPIVLVGQSENDNINAGNINYEQIAIDSIVDEWNNSFDYIQSCLIDYCGGYLRTRRENGTIFIDLLSDFGSDSVQPIELGRNLLDLTEELSVEDIFTVLIPLGDENLTIASVNGGSDELVDTSAVARFGRIVRTHVFSNVRSPSTLLENARRYLATNANVPRTITVRAVDLHLINDSINPIKIGDKVEITSYVHDIDDTLMCTKIEYDLEHPENNNYTFGNPKQTLTQRYREDIRLNNTPNEAAAKSASATAAAAADTAKKDKDESLQKFYDAWVKWNPDEASVSLRALSRDYYNGKEVLLAQCGIDLDGKTGNVDITSLKRTVDDYGRTIAKNTANISILEEENSVAIQSVTERLEDLADSENRHYTEITQRSTELGSSISLLAKDVSELDNEVESALASMDIIANDQEARITQAVSYVSKIDDRETEHYAAIEQWANEAGSAISLKADKIYVDGQLQATIATIEDLTTGRTTASRLRATDIMAGSISLWSEGGAVPVATMNHSHNFAIIEGNDGEVTFSIAGATTTIPQKQSFNIANTRYFKDHVAASGVVSLDLDYSAPYTDGKGYLYETGYKRYRIYMAGSMSNGSTKSFGPFYVNATAAYDAGKVEGQNIGAATAAINQVSITKLGDPTFNSETQTWHANGSVVIVPRGTKADGSYYINSAGMYFKTISFDVTKAYNAGVVAGSDTGSGDVSVLSLGLDPDDEISYSSTVNYYYVPIIAQLSNGSETKRTISFTAEAAQNAVTVSELILNGTSYISNSNQIFAVVGSQLSTGAVVYKSIYVPGEGAYNAGANSVTLKTMGLNTVNWSESSTGYVYETANKRFKVRLRGVLSTDKAYGSTIYIPAIDAHNAGIDAGAATVQIADVEVTVPGTPTYSEEARSWFANITVDASATATKSDNSLETVSKSVTKTVDVTNVYNAGYNTGYDDITVSRVSFLTPSINSAGAPSWNDDDKVWYSNARVIQRVRITKKSGTVAFNGTSTAAIDVTAAYNAGYDKLDGRVTIQAIGVPTQVRNLTWDSDGNSWIATADVNVNLGITKSDESIYGFGTGRSVPINVTNVYNAGKDAGAFTAYCSHILTGPAEVPYWNSEDEAWYSSVAITGTARGTKSDGTYYTSANDMTKAVDVTAVYDAAKEAGIDSVTVSTISLDKSASYDPGWTFSSPNFTVKIKTLLSNGTIGTGTVVIDASSQLQTATGSVTISTIDRDGEATYQTGYKRYAVPVKATASNEATKTTTIYVSATQAYDAGKTEGQNTAASTAYFSNALTSAAGTPRWNEEDQAYYSSVTITGTARATKADGTYYTSSNDITKAINVTEVYNAARESGVGDVTITSVAQDGEATYQTGYKRYSVPVIATASNNTTKSSTIYVSATQAYDAGKTEGTNSVTVDSVVLDTSSSATYQTSYKRYAVPVKATASNAATKTGTVYVSATEAYDAGKTEGQNTAASTAYFSNALTSAAGTPRWNEEDQAYYSNVTITGTARATKADGTYYTSSNDITKAVDVTEVYNAAANAGSGDVTLSSISFDKSSSSDPGWTFSSPNFTVKLKGTLSNGKTGTGTVVIDATSQLQAASGNVSISMIEQDGEATYQTGYKRYSVPVKATASNAATKTSNILVSATEAYDAGKDAGANTAYFSAAIVGTAGSPTYNSEDGIWTSSVSVSGTARGTKADGSYYTATRSISATANVTAVYNAVTVSTVAQDGEATYQTAYKRYSVPVTATASNGKTKTANLLVSATDAYDAGKTEGQNVVTISSTALNTEWSTSDTGYVYQTSSKRYAVNVKATASNGNSSATTLYVPATDAYNAGEAAGTTTGTNSVTLSSIALNKSSSSDPGWTFSSPNFTVKLKGTLSNGKTGTGTVTVDATSQLQAATNAVTISSTALNTEWSTSDTGYVYQTSSKRYAVNVKATASNGNSSATTLYVPATDAYDAGVTAGTTTGTNSVTLSSIALNKSSSSDPGWTFSSPNFTVKLKGTLSNGKTGTGTVTVDATSQLQAATTSGVNSVTISSTTLNTAWSTSSTGYVYQTANKRYAVNVKATASNGKYSTTTLYVPATDAYNAGAASSSSAVTSITVSRPTGGMDDWVLGDSSVSVKVNLAAKNGSTTLKTGTGEVNVDDIVNFFAVDSGTVLATTSSNYTTYDLAVNLEGYTNQYYSSGSYKYARIQLKNADGNNLSILRVQVSATNSGGSGTGTITLSKAATSSSVNPYYGTLTDYAWINNKHYCRIKAVATGDANTTQYYDINDIVNYAYQLGGGGSSSSVSVRSLRALTNKTYDSNLDMYYVQVLVTYSNGSTQTLNAYYN